MTGTCDTFKMFSFSVMQSTLYIRLVVGTARISALEKRNVDCMTEKLVLVLVISNRPRASRSSDFEITRAITP